MNKLQNMLMPIYLICVGLIYFAILINTPLTIYPFFFNFLSLFATTLTLLPIVRLPKVDIYKLILLSFLWGVVYRGSLMVAVWLGINFISIISILVLYIPFKYIIYIYSSNKTLKLPLIAGFIISYTGIILSANTFGLKINLPIIFIIFASLGIASSQKLRLEIKINSLALLSYISFIGSLMSLIISYIFEKPDLKIIGSLSSNNVYLIICTVIFNIAAFGSWNYVKRTNSSNGDLSILLMPTLICIVYGYMKDGYIGLTTILGGVINLCGSLIYSYHYKSNSEVSTK